MAKQTFTTGQVLTAAQMTSLQETAMGGGPATAKTASYVLVAADAGTTVAMNAAGATTITVNTGLFAAGDTVFIQNLGAGACTVTAGTATVATAGSLILPQNDAGILYFTATGTAIFYDYIQAGAVSPLTTKGDVYGFSTSDARIPIGANDTVLTADSTQSLGLKWATPSSGSMTLISTTTLTGSSITLSSIPSTYKNLQLVIRNFLPSSDYTYVLLRFNSDANSRYTSGGSADSGVLDQVKTFGATNITISSSNDNGAAQGISIVDVFDYTNTTTWKFVQTRSIGNDGGTNTSGDYTGQFGAYNQTGAISSIDLRVAQGTFTSGTVLLYGVN